MSINRVPIGGTANSQYHGQGKFCYYRKGSVASGLTDVAVYVDSAYMGLMSPTEHFSLNTKGEFWEFKPVDPALVGEFVLADTAEEYGSSAVAGTVAISGGSLSISGGTVNVGNLPAIQNTAGESEIIKLSGKTFSIFRSTSLVSGGTNDGIVLANPPTNNKNLYANYCTLASNLSSMSLQLSASIDFGTFTGFQGGAFPGFQKSLNDMTTVTTAYFQIGDVSNIITTYLTGAAIIPFLGYGNVCYPVNQPFKLDIFPEIVVHPGYFMRLYFNNSTGASVNCSSHLSWIDK